MLSEFVHEYHGRHLHATGMLRTEPEYLFARFAWAVLYLVKSFVLMGRKKTSLARYRVWDDGVARVKEQGMEAKEVDMLYGGGGTRSASPRKRSRTSSEQGREQLDYGSTCLWDGSSRDTFGGFSEGEERGRKRTREEDDERCGKRRRHDASESASAAPSLAETESFTSASSASTSPPRPSPDPPGGVEPRFEGGLDGRSKPSLVDQPKKASILDL